MGENWHNYLGRKNHQREFRKQLRLFILITLGFTIAFTWRQTVFDLSLSAVKFFTHINSSGTLSVLASTLITIISIVLIYASSNFLRENNDY